MLSCLPQRSLKIAPVWFQAARIFVKPNIYTIVCMINVASPNQACQWRPVVRDKVEPGDGEGTAKSMPHSPLSLHASSRPPAAPCESWAGRPATTMSGASLLVESRLSLILVQVVKEPLGSCLFLGLQGNQTGTSFIGGPKPPFSLIPNKQGEPHQKGQRSEFPGRVENSG